MNRAVREAKAEVANSTSEHHAEYDALRIELEEHRKLQAELTEARLSTDSSTKPFTRTPCASTFVKSTAGLATMERDSRPDVRRASVR